MSGTKILLFSLPNSLIENILSHWLDIHDVGMLDTAITNKKHRPEFLLCLAKMRNSTVPFFHGLYEHDVKLLNWMSLRHIELKTLVLEHFENNEFIEGL